ncbi:hypothetical protein D8I30_11450 [Brevundimonas naejangsanensis]|uniref:Uncharacterized protein n=1 Tax=Brevundimonas naejangsanensis TaxID=588932 RepID=A0A494RH20_9CAUL|nr:hypothetical protein [Brevundimonas naejangsanensis]AYG95725.1 hypothetical protein D8I30_11450 [Brevundimonas naejangsanensis]
MDLDSSGRPDRRPVIAICVWSPFYRAWDPIEDLSGEPWNPPGARTLATPGDASPDALAERLTEQLARGECSALLLVGRTSHAGAFRVQMRAENRRLGEAGRLDSTGPGVARVTAPVADILRDLATAGVSAVAASDAEEDAGSYILYRVLADLPDSLNSPSIGLLRIPDGESEGTVRTAVKTAASAMARRLAPLPRSSVA